jgi:hypothetical protein
MGAAMPKVSFGMIVLNGEPFLRYNLRALYPFAHQIIVAEGASPKAAHAATADGHSVDGTLATLRRFKAEEDREGKLVIVTAEDDGHPDGFWHGEKDQQSQAYARRATGDWLWQIDCDEFYQPADMARVLAYLQAHPETTCVTFRGVHFWGGFDYVVEGGLFMQRRFQGELWGRYRRLFKWGPGYSYSTHRPPTVLDAQGRDTATLQRRFADSAVAGGPVPLYHYMMLLPFQFTRKGRYYEQQAWAWERGRLQKYSEVLDEVNLQNGTRVLDQHNTYNWLRRFPGEHPPAVTALRADLATARPPVALRRTDDIERLLADPAYGRAILGRMPREYLRGLWANVRYIVYFGPRRSAAGLLRRVAPRRLIEALPARLRARLQG